MKFYAYEQSGVLQSVQWNEDEVFHHVAQSGDTAVIFARNREDIEFLNGLKLMYGVEIPICNYAAWSSLRAANMSLRPLPQWRFSLEPIPHY